MDISEYIKEYLAGKGIFKYLVIKQTVYFPNTANSNYTELDATNEFLFLAQKALETDTIIDSDTNYYKVIDATTFNVAENFYCEVFSGQVFITVPKTKDKQVIHFYRAIIE